MWQRLGLGQLAVRNVYSDERGRDSPPPSSGMEVHEDESVVFLEGTAPRQASRDGDLPIQHGTKKITNKTIILFLPSFTLETKNVIEVYSKFSPE